VAASSRVARPCKNETDSHVWLYPRTGP